MLLFNLRRYSLNQEMENQHRRQHAARHESGAARLLLWRDPGEVVQVDPRSDPACFQRLIPEMLRTAFTLCFQF